MLSDLSERLRRWVATSANGVDNEVNIEQLWRRGRTRRLVRWVGVVGVVAVTISVGNLVITTDPVMQVPRRDGPVGGSGGVGMGQIEQSPSQSDCVTPSEESYGSTAIGRWLSDLILHVGAPEEGEVTTEEIGDTGTALEIRGDAYSSRLIVYLSAQKPPDSDFSPKSAQPIGQRGDFVLYYKEGPAWKSFTALNLEWQLSLLAYPAPGHSSVPWNSASDEVGDWFERALSRAELDPPPCS